MKDFNNLSREKVARVAQGMGGEAFEKLAMLLPEAGVKYGDDTMGQDEAIKNMLSSEEWKAVLCGEKKLVAQEIERLFADKNSRIIPAHVGITSEVCDEETDFYVRYPNKFDYAEIIEFYKRFFHQDTLVR